MKKLVGCIPALLVLLIFAVITGCSGGSDSDTPVAGSEDFYDAGSPVNAVKYYEQADISLYEFVEDQGEFVPITDGYLIDLDLNQTKTLGVTVEGGALGRGKVYVSDGAGYQVRALLDESGFYVCDFRFDKTNIIFPVLVQEIYSNGFASKAKFLLTTDKLPPVNGNALVREGLAVTLGADLLDNLKEPVAGLLTDMLGTDITVNTFKPANNSTDILGKDGVIDLGLRVLGLPLTGDLVIDDVSQGSRGIFLDIEDGNWLAGLASIFALFPINMSQAIELDLAELIRGFLGGDDDDVLIKTLLPALYGLPEIMPAPVNGEVAYTAIGGGLYVADGAVAQDADENPIFPAVDVYELEDYQKLDTALIEPEGDFNMGLALSMYNLSQLIGKLVDGLKIRISDPDFLSNIPLIIPDYRNQPNAPAQELEISMNSAGIGLDLRSSVPRIVISDLMLKYSEEGKGDVWLISIDIVLKLDIDLDVREVYVCTEDEFGQEICDWEDHIFMDLYLEPITDGAGNILFVNTHLMWDNSVAAGLFDHSDFGAILISSLPALMGGAPGDPLYSVDFSGLGLIPKDVDPAAIIEFGGGCYMNMALEELDVAGLLSGEGPSCFINTAGGF